MTRTALAFAVLVACAWSPASRAETINCSEITSLPATLTSQGVYCLKHDLTTAMSAGQAITIAANNVTIDCNGYKVGGLGGGPATTAKGIVATARLNATVRNCSVRGFQFGIGVSGGGHLLESNRLDGNTVVGIAVEGDGIVVRGNSIFDTGDSSDLAVGIVVSDGSVDILDNLVSGVGNVTSSATAGMSLNSLMDSSIAGNRVRGVLAPAGTAYAIYLGNSVRMSIRDNQLFGLDSGNGIYCNSTAVTEGNHALGFAQGSSGCLDGGGNTIVNTP